MPAFPRSFAALALMTSVLASAPIAASASGVPSPSISIASFEGRTIDLRKSWGEASACVTNGVATNCFRTEKELQAWLGEPSTAARAAMSSGASASTFSSTCTTTLRLYDGTGYTGTTVYLTSRNIIINLSSVGFAARTSSYQVGGCSSLFKDQDNLLGSTYPGSTGAGVGATAMVTGWNNRLRSLYIS
jgi:hypothetical protein